MSATAAWVAATATAAWVAATASSPAGATLGER
jgi:hypothetical protein